MTGFSPIVGDIFVQTLNSGLSSLGKKFDGTAWVDPALMINGDLIATGTIGASEIVAGSIGTAQLAASAITTDKLAALSITTDKLAAGAITAAKLDVNSVFAQVITLPADGLIRAGTTTYAEMGGTDFFTAMADAETIFRIGRQNSHFINGKHITQTLPWQAFDSTVIPYIREQLALGAPSAGGSINGSANLGSSGVTVTTTTALVSAGASVAVSVGCSYGGFIDTQIGTIAPAIPVLTVQLQRITNGGSPVNIGASYQYTGSRTRGPLVDDSQYEWDINVPNSTLLILIPAPGTGNIPIVL